MDIAEHLLATTDRVARLRAELRDQQLDALLVTNPENRRYLSGFSGHDSGTDSAGALLVTADDIALITDGRYTQIAENESPGLRVLVREGAFAPFAATTLAKTGAKRIGIEALHQTVAQRDDLAAALAEQTSGAELIATRLLIEPLRAVKDADEIALIERAVAITDETFTYLCGYLRAGLTERQVADEIERYMREHGADGLAFDTIVASGPNSALPHATPTEREIGLGEPITIDMGARYQGYCSDMTRTVCLGQPGPDAQAIYDAVLRAQETCERGTYPGLTGQQVDALARNQAEADGYGEHYLHGTGHGLGLEIHEDPRINKYGASQPLEPGMVITIEPGIYIGGWGGVRIEDTAAVTEDGIRVLTKSHKRFALPAR